MDNEQTLPSTEPPHSGKPHMQSGEMQQLVLPTTLLSFPGEPLLPLRSTSVDRNSNGVIIKPSESDLMHLPPAAPSPPPPKMMSSFPGEPRQLMRSTSVEIQRRPNSDDIHDTIHMRSGFERDRLPPGMKVLPALPLSSPSISRQIYWSRVLFPLNGRQKSCYLGAAFLFVAVSYLVFMFAKDDCKLVEGIDNIVGKTLRQLLGVLVHVILLVLAFVGAVKNIRPLVWKWYALAISDTTFFIFAGALALWAEDFYSSVMLLCFALALVPIATIWVCFIIFNIFDCLVSVVVELVLKSKMSFGKSIATMCPIFFILLVKRSIEQTMEKNEETRLKMQLVRSLKKEMKEWNDEVEKLLGRSQEHESDEQV